MNGVIMKILIMGLPGSGKTWLGKRLGERFSIPHWDADDIRRIYNDWDFSPIGRERQSLRMRRVAEIDHISIAVFVCPLPRLIRHFKPDKLIWMDTIKEGRYEDTNKLFIEPINPDLRIRKWIDENQLYKCLEDFNLGTKDTVNFSNELMVRLAKL
jgi:adenylylsulfate kinase